MSKNKKSKDKKKIQFKLTFDDLQFDDDNKENQVISIPGTAEATLTPLLSKTSTSMATAAFDSTTTSSARTDVFDCNKNLIDVAGSSLSASSNSLKRSKNLAGLKPVNKIDVIASPSKMHLSPFQRSYLLEPTNLFPSPSINKSSDKSATPASTSLASSHPASQHNLVLADDKISNLIIKMHTYVSYSGDNHTDGELKNVTTFNYMNTSVQTDMKTFSDFSCQTNLCECSFSNISSKDCKTVEGTKKNNNVKSKKTMKNTIENDNTKPSNLSINNESSTKKTSSSTTSTLAPSANTNKLTKKEEKKKLKFSDEIVSISNSTGPPQHHSTPAKSSDNTLDTVDVCLQVSRSGDEFEQEVSNGSDRVNGCNLVNNANNVNDKPLTLTGSLNIISASDNASTNTSSTSAMKEDVDGAGDGVKCGKTVSWGRRSTIFRVIDEEAYDDGDGDDLIDNNNSFSTGNNYINSSDKHINNIFSHFNDSKSINKNLANSSAPSTPNKLCRSIYNSNAEMTSTPMTTAAGKTLLSPDTKQMMSLRSVLFNSDDDATEDHNDSNKDEDDDESSDVSRKSRGVHKPAEQLKNPKQPQKHHGSGSGVGKKVKKHHLTRRVSMCFMDSEDDDDEEEEDRPNGDSLRRNNSRSPKCQENEIDDVIPDSFENSNAISFYATPPKGEESDADGEDSLEKFLTAQKAKSTKKVFEGKHRMNSFIVDDDVEEEDDDDEEDEENDDDDDDDSDVFLIEDVSSKKDVKKKFGCKNLMRDYIMSDTPEEASSHKTEDEGQESKKNNDRKTLNDDIGSDTTTPHVKKTDHVIKLINQLALTEYKPQKAIPKFQSSNKCASLDDASQTYSFLRSLSNDVDDRMKDPEARRYTKKFKQLRSELSEKLFNLYNEKVFFNKLVPSCPLKWNKRLLTTAGYCCLSRKDNLRSFRIELSCKVCDDAERLRDTLIHEMCHAMVWMQYGERGHGAKWQLWARKSNLTLKDLPPITRCHSYKITTKFTYQCVRCSYKVGRHSRSLNTDKQVCPYCYGTFQLVTNQKNSSDPDKAVASRTPNEFARFVKENYGSLRSGRQMSHKQVMQLLSSRYSEKKLNNNINNINNHNDNDGNEVDVKGNDYNDEKKYDSDGYDDGDCDYVSDDDDDDDDGEFPVEKLHLDSD